MSHDDWAELKALFHTALERTDAEREAFLISVAQERPHLHERLRALVASHAEASSFLEAPVMADPSLAESLDASAPGTDVPELRPGDVLDGTYEIEATVGYGGMGAVYRVRHKGLGRTFAAKLIHPRVANDPRFIGRFTREAEALGRLKHPHIVDVTDFGVEQRGDPRAYLVMEYLQGENLEARLRAGPLTPEVALPIFDAVGSALDHAHRQGVLHLDLKPGNVLLAEDGSGAVRAKILDFGLAQFVSGDGSKTGEGTAPIGTPSYLAPEVLERNRPGPAADIYALGVLMYEALAGHRPFAGSVAEILDRIRHAEPPMPHRLNPAIPPEVGAALVAPLAKAPDRRPASAAATVAGVRAGYLAARQRHWRQTETPRRFAAATAITIALVLLSPLWDSAPFRTWENRSIDARFALAPKRPPQPGILLLTLDDASLAADRTPLSQQAERIAGDLQKVFDAGARAIAIDLLLPEPWSRSPAFAELVLRHADRLILAAFSNDSDEVIGPECIAGPVTTVLGDERAGLLFGFVNLDEDDDGVIRRGRIAFRDREGLWRPSFAGRTASLASGSATPRLADGDTSFWIDHTIDASGFERLSWNDLHTALSGRPELFRDRVVIAGGDYAGAGDRVRLPTQGVVPGMVVQAMTADTILAGLPIRSVARRTAMTLAALAAGMLSVVVLLGRSRLVAAGAVMIVLLGYVMAATLAFRRAHVVVPIVVPLVMCGLAAAVAGLVARARPAYPVE
jgi:serine/threonine protein kinase